LKKLLFWIGLPLAVIAVAFAVINTADDHIETELVRFGYLEDVLQTRGIVIRDEKVFYADSAGVFESVHSEGDRISRWQMIGTIYKGDIDAAIFDEINAINKDINALEKRGAGIKSTFDDVYKIDSQISARVYDIISYASDKNARYILNAVGEMNELMDARLISQGKKTSDTSELDRLYARKDEIEAPLVKTDLYASVPGSLSYVIDGFEDKVTPSSVESITPSDVDALLGAPLAPGGRVEAGRGVAKIIDNFIWYYVFNTTERELDTTKSGDRIYLSFSDNADDLLPVNVYYISPPQAGQVSVCVSSTRYAEPVLSNRKLNIAVVKRRYEGYKIPKISIRQKDGMMGVYVVTSGVAAFKTIDILYSDQDFAILSPESEANQLSLYDEIVVNAENTIEGKLLR